MNPSFENNKRNAKKLLLAMEPLKPTKVGESIALDASKTQEGRLGSSPKYFWSISDGGFYEGKQAKHAFSKPGVHRVTLSITNGTDTAVCDQYVSVNGKAAKSEALRLVGKAEPLPMVDDLPTMAVYGWARPLQGNFMHFHYRKNGKGNPTPQAFSVEGAKKASDISWTVSYQHHSGWVNVALDDKDGDLQMTIMVNADSLPRAEGAYVAKINLKHKDGQVQTYYVVAHAPYHKWQPSDKVVVTVDETMKYPSPYLWLQTGFEGDYLKGCGEGVTLWGGNANQKGFIRYQPDLRQGKYKVYLHEKANPNPGEKLSASDAYKVRVKTAKGVEEIKWSPVGQTLVGEFDFSEGKSGYVDIVAEGETLVFADALVFERIGD